MAQPAGDEFSFVDSDPSKASSSTDCDPSLTQANLTTNPPTNLKCKLRLGSETSGKSSLQCVSRVRRDMMGIYSDPPPGIFAMLDESDCTMVHALITGPFDTPYEGGFFYFVIRCPPDYPIKPPEVTFMTTGAGTVRFNPNLYNCGKVCISILGTWSGPAWSPALTIASVLISIQSLLTENPYHNEPGFERERFPGDSKKYNEIIKHETLRVAVCGMIDNDYGLNIPQPLVEMMNQSFLQYYEYYENTANEKMHLSGSVMEDPFNEHRGHFNYKQLKKRLETIYNRLKAKESEESSPSCSIESE